MSQLTAFLILSQIFKVIHGEAMCSDNSACSGLQGDCCPTTVGISREFILEKD